MPAIRQTYVRGLVPDEEPDPTNPVAVPTNTSFEAPMPAVRQTYVRGLVSDKKPEAVPTRTSFEASMPAVLQTYVRGLVSDKKPDPANPVLVHASSPNLRKLPKVRKAKILVRLA